mgnify:CR=1 FL=1
MKSINTHTHTHSKIWNDFSAKNLNEKKSISDSLKCFNQEKMLKGISCIPRP